MAVFSALCCGTRSQTIVSDWDDTFQSLEDVDDAESENWQLSMDELREFSENKLDLNNATDEDLLRLPFLSGQQVMDIREYLYHYGSMKSAAELMMIPSID